MSRPDDAAEELVDVTFRCETTRGHDGRPGTSWSWGGMPRHEAEARAVAQCARWADRGLVVTFEVRP